ncbi:MAG: phage minor capsid protein [Endomicrobium sp.]|jgi:hypothetical protein|nr:phage minor capsid protein [Endomicrobium sp.]
MAVESSGAFSAEQAIGNAVDSLTREGIHTIEYASGRNIMIEAGVRRAVVSGINRTACEVSLQRAEELGVDLVKTMEHLGARSEHALWQRQVFSLSGNGKYSDFYEETGCGEVDGLGGVNCRHSFYPFFEEYEEKKDYEAKIGDSKRNDEGGGLTCSLKAYWANGDTGQKGIYKGRCTKMRKK